ncbi:MAG: metal-dependent hydrolase [Gammaproteobacteria bacterium]|nr:metal-dependent hydrolase [Gammaproteobacteria bacterium]
MDPITHILSGAVVGRATASERSASRLTLNQRMVYGALAAEFPDVDFIASAAGTLTYLNVHRGITHSLVMMPVWALLLSLLFVVFSRFKLRVRDFYVLCAVCLSVHILGDLITPYGTKIFFPLSDYSAAMHTTFVIDPIITGFLVLGLVASLYFGTQRRTAVSAARLSVLMLAGYISTQGILHQRALNLAGEYRATQRLAGVRAYALPQPLSPFHWKLLLVGDESYWEAHVNLIGSAPRRAAPGAGAITRIWASYQPPVAADWRFVPRFGNSVHLESAVRAAWFSAPLHDFRRFARFPALYRVDGTGGEFCAYFVDLRFVMVARSPPFRFGVCRGHQGEWVLSQDSSLGRTG